MSDAENDWIRREGAAAWVRGQQAKEDLDRGDVAGYAGKMEQNRQSRRAAGVPTDHIDLRNRAAEQEFIHGDPSKALELLREAQRVTPEKLRKSYQDDIDRTIRRNQP